MVDPGAAPCCVRRRMDGWMDGRKDGWMEPNHHDYIVGFVRERGKKRTIIS
jgi:hypothetical protein